VTRIYIAGAWVEQHRRARPMIAKVREAGIVVTHDWTVAEGDVCSCNHHRQRHAPYAGHDVDAAFRNPTACADCGCETFNGIGPGSDSAPLTPEQRRTYAQADLDGVLSADVVWLLAANDKGACGSWVEIGAAIVARDLAARSGRFVAKSCPPMVIVSGAKNRRTIFTELADRLFDTDEHALQYITTAYFDPVMASAYKMFGPGGEGERRVSACHDSYSNDSVLFEDVETSVIGGRYVAWCSACGAFDSGDGVWRFPTALNLPGWTCPKCGLFTGTAKFDLRECRNPLCGAPRPT
jgi:hypothetical protein